MMTNLLSSSVARLRFLLVMLVTLTVSANAWAETVTETFTFGSSSISGWTCSPQSSYCGLYYSGKNNNFVVYNNAITNISSINFSSVTAPTITIRVKGITNSGVNSFTVSLIDNLGNELVTSDVQKDQLKNTSTNTQATWSKDIVLTPVLGVTGYKITCYAKTALAGTDYTLNYTLSGEGNSGGNGGDEESSDNATCGWIETDISNISSTDDVVITMTNGTTTWALTNGNGTSKAPAATVLTVNPDKSISDNIISSAIKWNISNSSGTLTIYPTEDTSNWLYCTATNNGVRVGTNTDKTFTIETSKQDDVDYKYLKHIGTSRYLGIYTGTPDWRCYTTATSNNAKQTLKFYKYVACGATETTYSVTYNANDATSGSVPKDNTKYAKDAQVTVLGNTGTLAKTGYTFSGWNIEANGTGTTYAAGATFNITENTTLYAKWTANTYTVTLNQKSGSNGTESISATYDATMPNITVPTRTGYTFGGYWTNENGTGTQYYNQSGGAYNNKKWDQATAATLYAKWTANKYTVKFNGNDNTGGSMSDQSFTYDTPQNLTTNAFTRIGYTFNGWNTNASGSGISYTDGQEVINLNSTSGGQITLYAQWTELPKYTVSFSTGTGNPTQVAIQETTGGAGITLPAGPTPACNTDGWTFAGWWTESVAETITSPGELLTAGSNYKPTSNCTLYAVYSHTEAGGGGSGFYLSVKQDATTYYIGEKGSGSFLSAVTDVNSAATFNIESNQYLYYGNKTYVSSTANSSSLTIATTTPTVTWAITDEGETITFQSNGTGERYLAFNYNSGSPRFSSYHSTYTYELTKHTTSTTTYNSNPSCEVCENILTINKGAETNGTFTLDISGDDIETCETEVSVVVKPTPANHYHIGSVTATTPTTGDAPTVTNNGDGTWTVTYKQNSTGESTINVTFVQDAKASITLSELSVPTTDNTTYYVGETYTLPSTSSQSCAGKQLVGWSTVEVAETDTKPTENYYELGAKVTLVAEQIFYAVFATEGEGGGGEYTLVTLANDFTDGVYVIAALDNGTYYFIDGNGENKGLGVEVNGLAASKVNNGSFSELSLPSGSVEIEFEDDGEPLDGNHYYFVSYYDETISNWKFLNDDGTNATLKWVEWYDGLTVYTYHPVFDTKTYLLSGSSATISQNGTTKASFIRNYANGTTYNSLYFFKKTGSSATYTAYTTSCIPTYSITYEFAGGTGSHCSNTSVPQGDPYTICDEAPTKEGHTFQGWSDGTSTYAAGATITPTKNITLTAQWQIKTYTVTWSNNGVTTPVTYEHGDDLTLPSTPASCDGVKEFVGWTEDNTFTYHATTPPSDLFTEKTATVTANATYYAVFATKGEGSANFVLGESGTFKMYANVEGTNYYAQGGVSSNKITSTTEAANASDYTLTYADGVYTIKQGTSNVGNKTNDADLNTNETTWTISEGTNGSWRVTSNATTNATVRALSYSYSNNAFKAYATSNIESGSYYDIEFGGTSSGYSDYTTTCQQIESIEVQNPQTEFYITDDFTIGSGKVIATLSGGGTTDVTALATFSGYNMNVVGTYTVTVTYMGATATYEINVKPLANAWVLTWNVSGKTNTGLGPRYVTKGSAIGTLPTPEVPAACAGKTFMGWTESNIVPSDGKGIVYITEETVPTKNTTYYAVFATVNNFCTQKPIDQIASGSKVVIVAVASLTDDGGSGKAISSRATDDTFNLQGDSVAIYDQTINTPHSTCIWTITKSGEKYIFTQDGKYLNGIIDGNYSNLKYNSTSDSWSLSPAASGMAMTYNMKSTNASTEYVEWYNGKFTIHDEVNKNGDFDMQFYVTLGDGADITDYTTGCAEYTITYYGFHGGYSTSCSSDGTIVLPVNSLHTVPDCGDVVTDHTDLGREFLNVWMTQPHGGHTFKPGDTFILTQDTTLYAQWKMETTSDVTTLPTDIEDLAGTDIYVYGGTTLNIQPGTTTINSLTLKGGLQADGSYKMPTVWVPEGATLVRNSNKIYLDLAINAKNYYPFAVPFATKNDQYIDYLDPGLNAASTYGTHFVIKTYDGKRRAINGEDRANNWDKVERHQSAEKPSYLQPGVGYIITALTRQNKDTATIRIPMTVPNTWFENGEQAAVGTTVRNTIAVTAHAGDAATEHQRHAGWNFVANPYLTSFAGDNVDNDGGLDYINGELIIQGSYEYGGEDVPYVTIPAYNFAYYSQHKLSDVKLSPEWSFFVQVDTDGTMNFTTAGRQQAPAHLAARAAEQPIKMDVDITLSDDNHSDQTGLIICDRFSDAYEIGHDLEKMFGSAYNLSVYTLMADNTPLAFQALAIQNSMQVIPVGYRTPAQGEYTFALNEATSDIELLNEQYEQLILVDYETGALTNMLNNEYTFYSDRTQSNNRFALYAVLRQNTTTDLPNTIGNEEVKKVIYNDHFYILRDGKVFNGAGQIVK